MRINLALSDKVVAARPNADKPAKNLLNFAFNGTAVPTLITQFLGDISDTLQVEGLYRSATTLNIKVESASYGTCETYKEYEDLNLGEAIKKVGASNTSTSGFYNNYTGIKNFNSEMTADDVIAVGDKITVLGTNLATGKADEFTVSVLGIEGLDVTKVGETQSVTIYFKDSTVAPTPLWALSLKCCRSLWRASLCLLGCPTS